MNTKVYVITFPQPGKYMADSSFEWYSFEKTSSLKYAKFFDSYTAAEEYYSLEAARFIKRIQDHLPKYEYPSKYNNLNKTDNETKKAYLLEQLSLFKHGYKIVCIEDKLSESDFKLNNPRQSE
jgi:mannose/cellobiose epimerase-like protein (N-acyl-D-glucosamine 2-epimerase family)